MNRKRAFKAGEGGFTIIETVIVVAVASLILLFVLLAIPALQRNSHNSERKQDVQAVLAAISRYKLNNSGAMPSAGSDFMKGIKLSAYNYVNGSGDLKIAYISGGVGAPTDEGINVYSELPTVAARSETNTRQETVNVYNYRKCSTTAHGASTNRGAGFGDVVALYIIETSNGTSSECQQM